MLSSSTRLLRLLSLLQTRAHWMGPDLAERLDTDRLDPAQLEGRAAFS